jgi:hypothetical protein
VFTPSMLYSTGWDDNVLLASEVDNKVSDVVNVLNPAATLAYNGKRGMAEARYDGAFLAYRQFDTLDSYDQHASLSGRRFLTPHISIFASNNFSVAPTTEAVQLVAVPFVRTGSDIDNLTGGVDAELSNRLKISASYDFNWVRFDATPQFSALLQGGHVHGGLANAHYRLSELTAITGSYSYQHAIVAGTIGTFDVQEALAGLERRLAEGTFVYGQAGFSRLGLTVFGPPQTGFAFNVGVSHQLRKAVLSGQYSRAFVPVYSFGGTVQNEEFDGTARLPVGRRVYVSSSIAWRTNQPLTPNGLNLRSVWYEGLAGYAFRPWVRLEGFYGFDHQNIERAGGLMDRNRFGVQVVTSTPMRLR